MRVQGFTVEYPGLNNYLEESLEQVSEDTTELDTTSWTCSLSADDPELRSIALQKTQDITWLNRTELGLKIEMCFYDV